MIERPRAFATFKRQGQFIFRTEAQIKWGEKNDPIGLLIMLNPGSSKLADDSKWGRFVSSKRDYETISGEVILDDTMKVVVHILEQSHPNLQGSLTIHNLFNLRYSESEKALSSYKNFFITNKRNFLYSDFNKCIDTRFKNILHSSLKEEYFLQFPWIWLAWTVNDGGLLNARRKQILDNIPSSKQKFAIYSRQTAHRRRKELYTYHVYPRIEKDRELYREQMIQKMKDYWSNC